MGCIPTKALLHFAEVMRSALNGRQIGVLADNVSVDLPTMGKRKSEIVDKHAKGIRQLFKKSKIDTISGFATLQGGSSVKVAGTDGEKTYKASPCDPSDRLGSAHDPGPELATGRVLTNVEILDLQKVPKSLAVIGAGAVGVEFASMYRSFGSDVAVFEMLPRMVPLEDEDVSAGLTRSFKAKGIDVFVGTAVVKIEETSSDVALTFTGPSGEQQVRKFGKAACGCGPQAEHRARGVGAHRDRDGSRVHPGQRLHGDSGDGRLRDRATSSPARRSWRTWHRRKDWSLPLGSSASQSSRSTTT